MTSDNRAEAERIIADTIATASPYEGLSMGRIDKLIDAITQALAARGAKAGHVIDEDGSVRRVRDRADCVPGCSKVGELLVQHELEPGETVMILAEVEAAAAAQEKKQP